MRPVPLDHNDDDGSQGEHDDAAHNAEPDQAAFIRRTVRRFSMPASLTRFCPAERVARENSCGEGQAKPYGLVELT